METQDKAKVITVRGDGPEKKICLCGRGSRHAARTDIVPVHPGTPWWNALEDAEEGETVELRLPSKTVSLQVVGIEPVTVVRAA